MFRRCLPSVSSLILSSLASVACNAQVTPPVQDAARSGPPAGAPDGLPGSRQPSVLSIAEEGDLQLDPAVPSPRAVLGFEPGGRPIRHGEILRYLERLAEASDRVELRRYAATHEGRDLVYVVVSDSQNMRRLDAIRDDLGRLADPRAVTDDAAGKIIESSPAVAWMAYAVHGDELSGTDAAVVTAYRLAAARDAETLALLRSVVVCIDPLQNPDGRERFLAMVEQLTGRTPSRDVQSAEHVTRWPFGRTNHYLADLNRDYVAAVHPETRGRIETIAGWFPQLTVDGHEMWPTDTYLFSPPTDPINLHIPPGVMKWLGRFAADQAGAFDRHGWSYYRGEWNEAWAIGFADVWAMHHGAPGILYEAAGSDGSVVRLPTGQDRRYVDDVARQYVSTMANLTTLARNRRDILADYYADKKRAVADAGVNGRRDVFLCVPGPNRTRAAEFVDLLRLQRIETSTLGADETFQDVSDLYGGVEPTRTFPPGTLVVSMKQPLSPLARAMLEFDPRMSDEFLRQERRELELQARTRLYDTTGWCLAMAFDLDAYWARADAGTASSSRQPATPDAVLARAPPATQPAGEPRGGERLYGYVIDGDDDAAVAHVGRLLQSGWHVRAANKPFTAAGRTFPAGSFLIRLHENEAVSAGQVANPSDPEQTRVAHRFSGGGRESTSARDPFADRPPLPPGLAMPVHSGRSDAGPDLGGTEFPLLVEPRIALVGEEPISENSHGAIWHLLDARIGLRISRLAADRLDDYDLRKYNVLVLPDSSGGTAMQRLFDKDRRESLRKWLEDGGTLVAVGDSARLLAAEEDGLTAVRLRRDVLDKLDEYAEAAWRERRAAEPDVDAAQVWDFDPAHGFTTTRPADERVDTDDVEALEREDEWARRFMPHGVILRADLRAEHWLRHGMRGRVPVMYGQDHALMARPPVETVARLAPAGSLRLTGLLWPEARRRLADAAYLTRESVGKGQVILFATDPVFRSYFRGTERLFLNAVILGPGVGASSPLPW